YRIALFLFLLPAWTWAQPELPTASAQQLALGAYRNGFAALPDSIRAGYGYFYPETEADLIPTLDCYSNPEVYLLELQPELLTYDTFYYEEQCTTTPAPTSNEVLLLEAAAAWDAWELSGDVLGTMLDGGDTEGVLFTVNDPYTPPKSVRQLLTAQAPWTSHPVLRAAVARADLSDLELYTILNAHVPVHPTVYTHALERWSDAPFWQAQLEAAQAGATPHACTQQQAQHAAWRNRALALEARAIMQLKNATQWDTWQAMTVSFPRNPVRMRWSLAQLGTRLNQCPNVEDYGVADPFGALLSAAGGLAPDDVAVVLGPDAGWRTAAAKAAHAPIAEPFAPALPATKSAVEPDETSERLITYPNPSAGCWHLNDVGPGTWHAYTLQGALIGTGMLQGSGDIIDGSAWPSGTYLLQVRSEHAPFNEVLIRH
ncbi:MAG: T9SS type A sorting domain-containing protein, partial [Flavobacteriales bacterium]